MKCPKCGSENTEPDMGANTSFSHGDINSWICQDCGYSGLMPENTPETISELENSETKHSSSNSSDLHDILIVLSSILLIILGAIILRLIWA